jgi:phage terminase large subunit
METTNVFEKNAIAYRNKERIIINQGGTRSSKTYSILQLLAYIAFYSKKELIISVVSYALPHLKLGAIREFEKILINDFEISPAGIRNKTENTYRLGKSIIEFFGVDNLGKVHGPERDILYVNEGNYIKSYEIVNQLFIRTRHTIFVDYNPSREFWVHEEILPKRPHELIKSTYLDNNFLTAAQIAEIESRKDNEQWWRVYGLGELGQLEDAILTNWSYGQFDDNLPYGYGLDFGSKHPDAMVKVGLDNKNRKLYWKEEIYKNGLSTDQLHALIQSRNVGRKLIIADSAGTRTITDLSKKGLNIRPVVKNKIVDDIKQLKNYKIIITEDSFNLAKNLNNWVWLDKKGEIPIDEDDDLIDAARYYSMTAIKGIFKPKGVKLRN